MGFNQQACARRGLCFNAVSLLFALLNKHVEEKAAVLEDLKIHFNCLKYPLGEIDYSD